MVTDKSAPKAPPDQERTLKDLTPNTAALLCYVGGWISGIVFLVLEQKNRFIRFHALQSIIVFGALTVANIILSQIPFIGGGFSGIIIIIAAIFWILLMIKAYAGESYKVIWAGNLAEKLNTNQGSAAPKPESTASAPPVVTPAAVVPPSQSVPPPPPPPPSSGSSQSSSQNTYQAESLNNQQAERTTRQDKYRAKYYSFGSRAGRITGSAFAIAWSIAFIIFFNFFSNYIGYYSNDHVWKTLVTSDFKLWLPIVTATLVLAVVGHTLLIIFDKYWLRQIVEIVLDIFSLATIISLLSIFPFDFSVLPNATAAYWAWLGLKIFLILISVGTVIGIIVKFIKFIVNLAEGRY